MIEFLTAPEVLTILESQLKDYGGVYGVRDPDLLHSALYTPQSSFNGEYLHKTIPAMAAAYAFHICQNHPFLDGNKRTALAVSLVFLDTNGYTLDCPEEALYREIMQLAQGQTTKAALTAVYEKYAKPIT